MHTDHRPEDDRRTIEETVEMMELMPEEARRKVWLYARNLFSARRPANPYLPLSEAQILKDISTSREEMRNGDAENAEDAIQEMRGKYGFI